MDVTRDDDDVRKFYDGVVAELRGLLDDTDEGSLWTLLLDGDEVLLATAIAGGVRPDDAQYCDNLAWTLDRSGAPAVLLVVPRRDGRATPEDGALWRRLSAAAEPYPVVLRDLLVVGADSWTSMGRT